MQRLDPSFKGSALLFCLVCCSFFISLKSQNEFGFSFGIINDKTASSFTIPNVEVKPILGAQAGGFFRLNLAAKTAIQLEINFIGRGERYKEFMSRNFSLDQDRQTLVRSNHIEFGAIWLKRFGAQKFKYYLGLGPFISYAMSGQITTIDGSFFFRVVRDRHLPFGSGFTRRFDLKPVGIVGMVLDFHKRSLFFEGRYQRGLINPDSSIANDREINNQSINWRLGLSWLVE